MERHDLLDLLTRTAHDAGFAVLDLDLALSDDTATVAFQATYTGSTAEDIASDFEDAAEHVGSPRVTRMLEYFAEEWRHVADQMHAAGALAASALEDDEPELAELATGHVQDAVSALAELELDLSEQADVFA